MVVQEFSNAVISEKIQFSGSTIFMNTGSISSSNVPVGNIKLIGNSCCKEFMNFSTLQSTWTMNSRIYCAWTLLDNRTHFSPKQLTSFHLSRSRPIFFSYFRIFHWNLFILFQPMECWLIRNRVNANILDILRFSVLHFFAALPSSIFHQGINR